MDKIRYRGTACIYTYTLFSKTRYYLLHFKRLHKLTLRDRVSICGHVDTVILWYFHILFR